MKKAQLVSVLALIVALSASPAALAEQWGDPTKLKEFVSREQVITRLTEIERAGLLRSQLAELPWSDTYWADLQGSIARPYAELASPKLPIFWAINGRYFNGHRSGLWNTPPESLGAGTIDKLAPSEKYDLLLGDRNYTLTRQVIAMVNELFADDQTATWSGVCHGWSAASLNLPRPLHSFQLRSPSGIPITFYPADVKALSSFLWGKSFAQDYVKLEGAQCKKEFPKTDRNGRLLDPHCFDVNPAFFHLLLVNQIGLNQRGMIIDRSYKKRIMNQPVYGYDMAYYNPNTKKPAGSVREALVKAGDFTNDPYPKYRAPGTKAVIGFETTVQYRAESSPEHKSTDGPEDDKSAPFVIQYDLELDENLNIIGGEWRSYDRASTDESWWASPGAPVHETSSEGHPDIVWLTPPGLKAYSIADADIGGSDWDGTTPAPEAWREAAQKAAGTRNLKGKLQPQPLARVVDLLLEYSRK